MGENVDVKALTARFRQTGMLAGAGGGPMRLPPPVLERGSQSPADFGGVRSRLPAPSNKPGAGSISPSNGPRFGSAPHGVFPRPPPSHRTSPQEPLRPPFTEEVRLGGPLRQPGERPQVRAMPKPQGCAGARPPQAFHTPPLRMKRSTSDEVAPLLRPLPAVGPRPSKPRRPPFVNLEQFRRSPGTPTPSARLSGRTSEGGNSPLAAIAMGLPRLPLVPNKPAAKPASNHDVDDDQDTYDDIDALPPPPPPPPTQEGFSPSLSRPPDLRSTPLVPVKPSRMTASVSVVADDDEDDQDTYDDIDALPPPPPPPPGQSQDSWTDQHSSQAEEWDDSDESEIYEEVDNQESVPVRADPRKQTKKDMKRQKDQEKKEQREREKKESAIRKKFKLTGKETPLHTARVRVDWQGGRNDLVVYQGDSVEIIRIENNPEGRWLARSMDGTYGYISTKCVDMDYEEVKRRFGSLGNTRPPDRGLYDDVDSPDALGNDDDRFPPPPLEISPDPKMLKKMEKEEKEFRKKFKFDGPIRVLQYMRVDLGANIKKAGGGYLNVARGETVEVLQFTSDKKALCRNAQGKCGYVSMAYLRQEEAEIYDDVDHPGDVYDN